MTLAAHTSEYLLAEEYDGRRLPPSSLPWYAVNGKDPMDKLFTDRGVAAHCYDVFRRVAQDNGHDLSVCVLVEPSAGEGCFTDLLPENRIALDGSGYGVIVKDSSIKESILNALARADWLEHSSRRNAI